MSPVLTGKLVSLLIPSISSTQPDSPSGKETSTRVTFSRVSHRASAVADAAIICSLVKSSRGYPPAKTDHRHSPDKNPAPDGRGQYVADGLAQMGDAGQAFSGPVVYTVHD